MLGGERSFSTLCFALALHEMTESPFKAMDEFDVFMVSQCDVVNSNSKIRRKYMGFLISMLFHLITNLVSPSGCS